MSYILKALEKLEEDRPKTEPPGLQKEPDKKAARPHRLRFLPHLLVAALLINAGIFLWWLHPWEKGKSTAMVPGTPLPEASFTSSAAPSVPFSVPLSANSPQPAEEKISVRGKDDNRAADGNIREKRENSVSNAGPGPADAGTRKIAREDRTVYSLDDLPSAVRQGLPPIAISGHSYSADPASRIVLINGSTMREGQAVTGGLRLEQITSDGVILSYQGYRLRKGVF